MQNKKLLFLCLDSFDLYKVFRNGLEKYSDYEITTILYKDYKYKNLKERIINFLSKTFLKKNLKKEWQNKAYFENIDPTLQFDCALTLCPDVFALDTLQHVKNISKKSIVYYWDGFDHFPTYKKSIGFFDKSFTFDPEDAKKYNLNFLPNFYFAEDRNENPEMDLFFLSSFDNRYPLIEQIVLTLEKQNKHLKIKILQLPRNNKISIPTPISNSIEFINEPISFAETTAFMKNTKIVLDIQKDIQHGLTFRVFEAMGLGKKLITTNPDIVHYDFYNPNNIFIWTKDTSSIPESFLNTPYEELPEKIYQKYSQKNWVKTILDL